MVLGVVYLSLVALVSLVFALAERQFRVEGQV